MTAASASELSTPLVARRFSRLIAFIVLGDEEAISVELSQLSNCLSALPELAALASANGQAGVLGMLLRVPGGDAYPHRERALVAAAACGRLEIVRLLHQQGADLQSCEGDLVRQAAFYGHLDVLRYLHENGLSLAPCQAIFTALAENPARQPIVQYLSDSGVAPTLTPLSKLFAAIRTGSVGRVRGEFRDIDLDRSAVALLDAAARVGSVDVIRFLHQSGVQLERHAHKVLLSAAQAGSYRVLRYVIENSPVASESMGEALKAAAESGSAKVVEYLLGKGITAARVDAVTLKLIAFNGHERVFDCLTDAGLDGISDERPVIEAMAKEVLNAKEVYQPSALWQFFNERNLEQLRRFGMSRFKRCVNQNYFNFVPLGPHDEQFRGLLWRWLRRPVLAPLRVAMVNPDRYASTRERLPIERSIFRLGAGQRAPIRIPLNWAQRNLYRLMVGLLWDYVVRNDKLRLNEALREPRLGAPIETWSGRKQISQDLAHSIFECNTMLEGMDTSIQDRPIRIAEVGPGYGRVGDVLLSTRRCKYVVFDIPPSLHVVQWYLSRRYPFKRIFKFRHIDRFDDVWEEFEAADIAFLTPNQLELLDDEYFDLAINISSLHEMRPAQLRHILGEMCRITAGRVYIKQYKRYVNPWDELVITASEYSVPDDWRTAMWRHDPIDARFFEAIFERSADGAGVGSTKPEKGHSPHAAADKRPTISILLANYNDAPYLETSVSAILAQSDPPDEIVIVDDGSTDDSLAVIERLTAGDARVRVLRHERNRGQLAAIQRALHAATSDYVAWASADDLLLPNFVERGRRALMERPGVGLCFSRLCAWRDGTSVVNEFTGKSHGAAFDLGESPRYYSPEDLGRILRKHYLWISGNTVIARRDALIEMGGFPRKLRWHADWFSFYAVALRHGAYGIPETLAMMRERPESYSRGGMQDSRAQGRVLRALVSIINRPCNRDLKPVFRSCPSLFSPFGRRMVTANMWRPKHWDLILPLTLWQARRKGAIFVAKQRARWGI